MSRFLLAIVSDKSCQLHYRQEVFEISEDCKPHEVKIPEKTILFTFVRADVKSAKELAESYVFFQTGLQMIATSALEVTPENNGKRYFVGKVIPFGGIQAIHNERANSIIPFVRLVGNDEIIDL